MFLNQNIFKYTYTSPDGKNHIKTDHILIDMRQHSNFLMPTLLVSKQAARKFDTERFSLKKLNKVKSGTVTA